MWEPILTGLSFTILLIVLWADFFISKKKKVFFMTNQAHVSLYMIPILLSFVMIILSQNSKELISLYEIILIVFFIAVYLYMIRFNKIILVNAFKNEVVELISNFLNEEKIQHSIFASESESVTLISIDRLRKAFVIKDFNKWIEIDSTILNNPDLLIKLDKYIKANSKDLKSKNSNHLIFFILLNILIILLATFFILKLPKL